MIKKSSSLFSSDIKKRVCLASHWQNLKLQALSKGCFPWVKVQDFTVHYCSRSKLTDWTSACWIKDKMASTTHEIKIAACGRSLLYMQNTSVKV